MGAVRHGFTVEEFHKMGEADIFCEDDRVELMDGEVVEMTPIGWRHALCVTNLTALLTRFTSDQELLGRRYMVSVQNPVALSQHREPQPDLSLVEGPPLGRLPGPAEIAPAVEVADASLSYDRERKLPLYAEAGIPEAWLVDPGGARIEDHSEPGLGGYGKVSHNARGEGLASPNISGLVFDVAEALPPEHS